eukprot:COSAG01_NODE_39182_length_479_cov_110.710526_1_plen_65_part_01
MNEAAKQERLAAACCCGCEGDSAGGGEAGRPVLSHKRPLRAAHVIDAASSPTNVKRGPTQTPLRT